MVCANVYGLCWSTMLLGQDGMRCALVLFKWSVLEDFFPQQVLKAPGSTVVSSHSSPADLAEKHKLRSRWAADVGIALAISKLGLQPASSAGQVRLKHPRAREVDRFRSLPVRPKPCAPACWPRPRRRCWDACPPSVAHSRFSAARKKAASV